MTAPCDKRNCDRAAQFYCVDDHNPDRVKLHRRCSRHLDPRWYDVPIAEYHADDEWCEHLIESKAWGVDMARAMDSQAGRHV